MQTEIRNGRFHRRTGRRYAKNLCQAAATVARAATAFVRAIPHLADDRNSRHVSPINSGPAHREMMIRSLRANPLRVNATSVIQGLPDGNARILSEVMTSAQKLQSLGFSG